MTMRQDCSFCNGTGTKPDTIFQDCMECSGTGWFDDVTDAGYKQFTPMLQTPTQPDNVQPAPTGGAIGETMMSDLQDELQAAYEADLAEGDNEMWQWARESQAEASAGAEHQEYLDSLPLVILDDDELLDRAKKQLAALRLTQAEIAKRHNARQTPAKAVCGHTARDHSGLCCDDPTCPRYVPF